MRTLCLVLICALAGISCRLHPKQYFIESSFGLGTNAVVNINQKLPVGGYYEFTFEFLQVDHENFQSEKWPLETNVDIHVMVKTNGQTAMDTNISKLEFSHISEKRNVAAYFPSSGGFIVTSDNVALDCTLEDKSNGPKHPVRLLLSNAVAK